MAELRPPRVPTMLRLWLLWAGVVLALGSPNTSPNSAVMPSVSYLDLAFGWNRSSLEKDIAAVFNKVAYGSTTPPSNPVYNKTFSGSLPVITTTIAPTPLSVIASTISSSTTAQPRLPITPSTLHAETPEYVSRTRFKPPLPPEYTNPFADKPILRGSQSENSAGGSGRRRPLPLPPPPRPPRPPPEQERIPIRPPDLVVPPDRNKKPLNTPARGTARPQQAVTYAQDVTLTRVEPRNDTEFDFVPILQNPSVTRILSGSSGRKDDDERRNSSSRVLLDDVGRDSMVAVQQPVVVLPPPPELLEDQEEEVVEEELEEREEQEQEAPQELPREEEVQEQEDEDHQVSTDPSPTQQESDWDNHVWGVAWDIHVYLMGSLFALLALISTINFIRTYKRLLPKGYFVSLNGLLLIIGVFRSIFLFYDAYNLHHSYPAVISPLMLNFAFPCLTSAFAILFLYLLQTAKVKLLNMRLQTPAVVAVTTLSHLLLCLSLDVVAGCLMKPHSKFLLLVCQALFLVWGVALAVTYLFVFGALSRAALHQQCDFLRAPFTKLATLPPQNPTLGLAVRALLATAMLMLLLAAVQLYGLFGVYGVYSDEPPRPWPWWGFQFSVRVIEVSMCFLMVFVATLRHSDEESNSPSVFTLFSCKNCTPQEENKTTDDLYPAICSTNQAIHNYSIHTGKKVYDDSFPLSNMTLGDPMIPVSVRMSMKKSGTMLSTRSEGHHSPSSVHSQRPSSMLFAEDGFVRFRTSADPEQPMEEVLHQSVTRTGGKAGVVTHEAVTAFNLPPDEVCIEQTKVRYRPGMLEELKYDMRGMLPPGMPPPPPQQQRSQLLHQGECRGGRQRSAVGGCGSLAPHPEMWRSGAGAASTSPPHGHLPPASLHFPHHPHNHHLHPSESSDSDLASNSDEDQDSPPPSSSQDITPDSAVGSDIYSKNGEGPVENNRYWCEDEQICGLDLLSRSLINRLKGSNFSLNHLQGYTPLDSVCHSSNEFKRVLLGHVSDPGYYLNACKLEALYNIRPEDESAV